jgi:tRNA-binding EMAP/Myf-like protein
MAPTTAVEAGISKIDELIEQLIAGTFTSAAQLAARPAPPAEPTEQPAPAIAKAPKPGKPAKAAKGGSGGGGGGPVEGPDLFARAHFAVARVVSVADHPASDKLLITSLDVGGGATRQVVAGLRQHVAAEALQGSCVGVVLNLKPARLAGEASEGMILAASAPQVSPARPPPHRGGALLGYYRAGG